MNPFSQKRNAVRVNKAINTSLFLEEFRHEEHLTPTFCTRKESHYCIRENATHYFIREPIRGPWDTQLATHDLFKNAPTENYNRLPVLTEWLEKFANEHNGTLGRAYISILEPRKGVLRHYDTGTYPILYNRYHLILQSEGTKVTSGEDTEIFNEGEVWWFNNFLFHEFSNDSEKERIHVIFDVMPRALWGKMVNTLFWLYCSYKKHL